MPYFQESILHWRTAYIHLGTIITKSVQRKFTKYIYIVLYNKNTTLKPFKFFPRFELVHFVYKNIHIKTARFLDSNINQV